MGVCDKDLISLRTFFSGISETLYVRSIYSGKGSKQFLFTEESVPKMQIKKASEVGQIILILSFFANNFRT